MIENWVFIKGFEGVYMVSDHGRIKAVKRERNRRMYAEKILKVHSILNGYQMICLYKNGRCNNYLVHRIVATEFIGDIPNKMVINHIDNDPSNNHVSNLEIVTQSQNILYSFAQGRSVAPQKGKFGSLHNAAKSICAFKDGNTIGVWGSIKELKEALGIKSNNISGVIKGDRPHMCGYTFKYM